MRFFNAFFNSPYLLLVLAPLAWGGNAVAGRLAADNWLPFTFTSIRWLLVMLILLPFVYKAVWEERKMLLANAHVLFALGGLGLGCFNMGMYLALHHTSAINVSVEQAAMPMIIMLLNFLLLRQRVMWQQIAGLSLAIIGVALTATRGEPFKLLDSGMNRGDAIMICAAFLYAAYSVGLRWKPAVSWRSFMFALALSAFIVSIPFSLFEASNNSFPDIGSSDVALLVFVALFPSILAQLCFARGVELIGANRAGQFINLVPIFGALLAVIILGEAFHWYHAAGLLAVFSGIALAERSTRSKSYSGKPE